MFEEIKKFFSKFTSPINEGDVQTEKNTSQNCQLIDRKYESVYYNLPVGMITLSLDNKVIENYNGIFASFLSNFYYPHGVGKKFTDLVFKNNQEDFDKWIKNIDENTISEGIELRLIKDKCNTIDVPILIRLNKLLISKHDNLIVLSAINIDTYLNDDLRLEEEKYLLEKNNCVRNRIFIETFLELKSTILKFTESVQENSEAEKLKDVIDSIDRVLNYYQHNSPSCPYCDSDGNELSDVAKRINKRFENISVLVVDDMESNLDLVRTMLKGFVPSSTVDLAKDGKEALTLIAKNKYDIIFVDLVMPIMDGYEIIEKLRDKDSGYNATDLPIVVLTSMAHTSDKERALGIGVNDYLTKPVHPRELVRVLEKWI